MKKFYLLFISIIILTSVFSIYVYGQNSSPYANRIRLVSSNPLTCTPSQVYFNTTSLQFIICTTLNTFTGGAFNGTLSSGQFKAPNGTSLLPSFSFTSDPDTGIFRDSANTIGVTTGGTERFVFSQTAFNPLINNTYDLGNGSVNWRDVNIARSLILYGLITGNVNLKAANSTTSYTLMLPVNQGAGFLVNQGDGSTLWDNTPYLASFSTLFVNQTTNQVPRTTSSNTLEDSPIYAASQDIRIDNDSGTTIIGDVTNNAAGTLLTINGNGDMTLNSGVDIKLFSSHITPKSILYLDAANAINSTQLLGGQLLIGVSGDNPQAGNITSSNGINIANNSGSIEVSSSFYSSGTPTSISGGGGVLISGSKDSAGKFTTTTTGANSITITFSTSFLRAPACFVTNETTANLARGVSTTTTLIFNGITVTGDTLSYVCLGY